MDFVNRTDHSAMLFRGVIREQRMFASLACRINYDLIAGELVQSADQPWPISPGPWESPQGPFAGDELFYRGGVDLFVFGKACAPPNRLVPRIDVVFEVGDYFSRSLAVFGNRTWQKQGRDYVMSAPEPFSTMPLTIANAYGGKDLWDEMEVPYGANPDGKGFCFAEDTVLGKSLPNIEDPDRLITSWRDQPEPVGCAAPPPVWGVRVQKFVEFDLQTGLAQRIDPRFFNTCFPDMIITRQLVRPGDRVRITNMKPGKTLEFVIPPIPVGIQVWIDDYCHSGELVIDQIGIDTILDQVFITYRYPFRYEIVPLEKRTCLLVPAGSRTDQLPEGHTLRSRTA